MSNPKNNFKNPENVDKSPYKLWVKYHLSAFRMWKDISRNPATYYAFNSKTQEAALAKLMELYNERKQHIETAIIYDNLADGKPIFRELKIKDLEKW